ncbi:protein phosphatase 2C, putative [Hepatocystis sp. ex Piliocolobus tephrosceles]|nr:protein phosphatase 2C, putative [Hepatocystis sp. ex Piliocolobus tephrosceles]
MGAYLSAPKTDKESCDGGNLELDPSRYGLSCMQGWRKNMEDSHICYNKLKVNEIEEDISIYGVFDGHGGPNVSKWISYNFCRVFIKCLKEANDELVNNNINESKYFKLKLIKLTLEKTFLKLDKEMLLTENQEKLKKYSVPAQETEEEPETRENYLYSILNDIISKNISIKALEKDGKRCLQVVYNKDRTLVDDEENPVDSIQPLTEDNEHNNDTTLTGDYNNEGIFRILKEDDETFQNDNTDNAELFKKADSEGIKKMDNSDNSTNISSTSNNANTNNNNEDNDYVIKTLNTDSETFNVNTNDDNDAKLAENDKNENSVITNNDGDNSNNNDDNNSNTNILNKSNILENEQQKTDNELSSASNISPKDSKNKIKDEKQNKEQSDYSIDENNTEITNIKRLKKDENDEFVKAEREELQQEGGEKEKVMSDHKDIEQNKSDVTNDANITENNELNKSDNKVELTFENLKCMEKLNEEEENKKKINNINNNNETNEYDNNATNNNSNTNVNPCSYTALKLYEKDMNEEGFSLNEVEKDVIDNNITDNTENGINVIKNNIENVTISDTSHIYTEEDDSNNMYSPDELRLYENYYPNNYEDNIAYSCGSTAIVAVLLKGYLIVANAGDSRAIICFKGNSLDMSTDHKPHLQEEEERIKKAGGYISNGRVDGNLNLTRAIGDLHFKNDPFLHQKDQKISAFPEIKCVTLTPDDEFLFLACDGIWDCKDGNDVVNFVKTRLNKFEEPTNDNNDVTVTNNKENEIEATDITTSTNTTDNNNLDNNQNKTNINEKENNNSISENDIITKDSITKQDNNNIQNVDNITFPDNEQIVNNNHMNNDDSYGKNDNNNVVVEQIDDDDYAPTMDRYNEYDSNYDSTNVVIERKKLDKFNKLSQICEELCDDCLSNNYRENDGIGCDNMTCLIVQYNPEYKIHNEKKFLNIDQIE